jgi:radical SAM superfamily enzyme YgiQ (UPF0313 family)
MSRILLVNPPFYRLLGSHYNGNPSGIAYIASYLNNNGHDAWIYNADFLDGKEYASLSKLFGEFNNYKEYFLDTNHKIWHEIVDNILSFKPDWVGYTCYTANVKAIDILSNLLSEKGCEAKQVIGGTHPTLDRGILKTLSSIDYAVAREGEHVMLKLVNGDPIDLINGVLYVKDGDVIDNGDADVLDCDSLPFPEREKFWILTDAQKKQVDVSYISTVRGCPYSCTYCASPQSWKRNKTEYRSADSILSELHHLKDNYWDQDLKYDYSGSSNVLPKSILIEDNSLIYFVDDAFTLRRSRTIEILTRMISESLDMPWKCEARADHLDDEICLLMSKSNCVRAKIGFESGSERILKMIKKGQTKDKMREGALLLKKYNIPFTGYFMTGFPGETDDDLRETIEFAKEISPDFFSLSILSPYYGTQIYYDLVRDGYDLDKMPWEYFYHQTGELMVNDELSPDLIKEFLSLNENRDKIIVKGYV